MKNKRIEQLMHILENSQSCLSSQNLSKMIGVSEKTVRNYIKELNHKHGQIIQSSSTGYKIEKSISNISLEYTELEYRENYIFSRLLAEKEGVSVFDLAEELNVSESTIINNSLPRLKEITRQFKLEIKSNNYVYYLSGKERDKRKLIGYLATHNSNGYFTSFDTLEKMFSGKNVKLVLDKLKEICQESNLFLNDYSLNNFLVHVIIIWLRTESNNTITINERYNDINNIVFYSHQKNDILKMADLIVKIFEDNGNLVLSQLETDQIIALITVSVDHNHDIYKNVLDPEMVEFITEILKNISLRFSIPEFDCDFTVQFSLHMYNALQRSKYKISYPNPIKDQIKNDYAPIYDMAILFTHIFSKEYSITMSEDEITFIAFHIGAYIEKNKSRKDLTTCVIICENYYNIHKQLISQIRNTFQSSLTIIDILSPNDYGRIKSDIDLVISTLDIPIKSNKIVVNPILTKSNIQQVWSEIETIEESKAIIKARRILNHLMDENLYLRDINLPSREDFIRFMGDRCRESDYINEDFINDVILRESVSSTAFNDSVAIPHSISKYANKSFIFILHNNFRTNWGDKKVRFIFMIGIAKQDMRYFKDALNLIIEVFSSTEKTLKILNTETFEEFKRTILNI